MNDDGTAALLIATALVDLLNRSPGGEGIADRIDQYMVEALGRPGIDDHYRSAIGTARNALRGSRSF